jgi:hypothetical protein
MTVLVPSNALPAAPFLQHLSGQTATVASSIYPGAVQPKSTAPAVLSYTNALPAKASPQHLSGQTATVQSYLYPGAVQPAVSAPPSGGGRARVTIVGSLGIRPTLMLAIGAVLLRNPTSPRRAFMPWAWLK